MRLEVVGEGGEVDDDEVTLHRRGRVTGADDHPGTA